MIRDPNVKKLGNVLICFLLGLASFGFGAFLLFQKPKGFVKIPAVISHVEVIEAGEETEGKTTVQYSYEGKEYEAIIDAYSSGYKEGKEISIYIDPADPQEAVIADTLLPALLVFSSGLVAWGFGVLYLARRN